MTIVAVVPRAPSTQSAGSTFTFLEPASGHSPMTGSQWRKVDWIWRRVFEEWLRYRRLSKKLFRECWWFSNFSILCRRCSWKLLVCHKTLIYCGELCDNAVNYPSTPLNIMVWCFLYREKIHSSIEKRSMCCVEKLECVQYFSCRSPSLDSGG
jgi:hypothetical protein